MCADPSQGACSPLANPPFVGAKGLSMLNMKDGRASLFSTTTKLRSSTMASLLSPLLQVCIICMLVVLPPGHMSR